LETRPYLGYVLEPEILELFVDLERSAEKNEEVTSELERRMQEKTGSS